jgi:hypothetical protein
VWTPSEFGGGEGKEGREEEEAEEEVGGGGVSLVVATLTQTLASEELVSSANFWLQPDSVEMKGWWYWPGKLMHANVSFKEDVEGSIGREDKGRSSIRGGRERTRGGGKRRK